MKSEVPDSWLKGNKTLSAAMTEQMENWKEQRQEGVINHVIQNGVLAWGFIMFLVLAALPALKSEEPLNFFSLLSQAGVWALGGALLGFINWKSKEKQYLTYIEKNPQLNTEMTTERVSFWVNTKLNGYMMLAAMLGVFATSWAYNALFKPSSQNRAEFLKEISEGVNENLPLELDSETIWFSSSATEDSFTYSYQLPNYDKENIDIKGFIEAMSPGIETDACTLETTKSFRDLDVILLYKYHDTNNSLFAEIKVDTKECIN